MKSLITSFLLFTMLSGLLNAQYVEIPDTTFLNALIDEGVDTNGDSLISTSEAEAITSLSVDSLNISDLIGIEAFVNLKKLDCHQNRLTSLDVSNNTALYNLYCNNNQLTNLDVSGCTALHSLVCYDNQLTSLDISNNTSLDWLICSVNQLTSLDVSNNTALYFFGCNSNQLTSLDVSNNTALYSFNCNSNQLTSLDVSGCTALELLLCGGNQLTSLGVSNNSALWDLYCNSNQLTNLDVSGCTALRSLVCWDNQLTSLNISNNTALRELNCSKNQLTSLDISNNTSLYSLRITDIPSLYKVCVWEMPFPPAGVEVYKSGSPNVYFTTEGCSGTGIVEHNPTELLMFPNPANDLLTIEVNELGLNTIEITSLNGQLKYTTRIEGPTFQIDLSRFQKGVYFITVRSKDYISTNKIIKL